MGSSPLIAGKNVNKRLRNKKSKFKGNITSKNMFLYNIQKQLSFGTYFFIYKIENKIYTGKILKEI